MIKRAGRSFNSRLQAAYLGCDRHCFYFWRVEWLEKIEPEKGQGKGQGA